MSDIDIMLGVCDRIAEVGAVSRDDVEKARAELAALREKAASVDAAVKAEREACAAIVEDSDLPEDLQGYAPVRFIKELAASLRARSNA